MITTLEVKSYKWPVINPFEIDRRATLTEVGKGTKQAFVSKILWIMFMSKEMAVEYTENFVRNI